MELGQIVLATKGRDKDGHFVVVAILDDQYVMIANGASRKFSKPKKKKVKHLKALELVPPENLRQKILEGQKVGNQEIRRALAFLTAQTEESVIT